MNAYTAKAILNGKTIEATRATRKAAERAVMKARHSKENAALELLAYQTTYPSGRTVEWA